MLEQEPYKKYSYVTDNPHNWVPQYFENGAEGARKHSADNSNFVVLTSTWLLQYLSNSLSVIGSFFVTRLLDKEKKNTSSLHIL